MQTPMTYVACDVPEGMTLDEYRHGLASAARADRAARPHGRALALRLRYRAKRVRALSSASSSDSTSSGEL
jgi:hypothetical protein